MKYVVECLHGHNGLLNNIDISEDHNSLTDKRREFLNLIFEEGQEIICELCEDYLEAPYKSAVKKPRKNRKLTLVELMEHECYHEYERVKMCIYDSSRGGPVEYKDVYNKGDKVPSPFSPLFLSALLN
jgi:hypothetical protein